MLEEEEEERAVGGEEKGLLLDQRCERLCGKRHGDGGARIKTLVVRDDGVAGGRHAPYVSCTHASLTVTLDGGVPVVVEGENGVHRIVARVCPSSTTRIRTVQLAIGQSGNDKGAGQAVEVVSQPTLRWFEDDASGIGMRAVWPAHLDFPQWNHVITQMRFYPLLPFCSAFNRRRQGWLRLRYVFCAKCGCRLQPRLALFPRGRQSLLLLVVRGKEEMQF